MPKDADIIAWANSTVAAAGKASTISSFKDSSLGNGLFLLDLLGAIEPRAINPSIPTAGESDEDKAKNCKYVIAVARKVGAQIFCSWDDVLACRSKMIFTLVGGIMHAAQTRAAAKGGAGAAGGAGAGSA